MLAAVPLNNQSLVIAPCRHGTFAFHQTDMIGRMLLTYGEWAEQEIRFLSKFLKPGDTVLDVGSHIGTIAVPLARAVGPTGQVFCFEAQRYIYYNLCTNILINGLHNVTAVHAAVADRDGFLALRERKPAEMTNSGHFTIPAGVASPASERHTRMLKLDSFFISTRACRLIKLDIEGYEALALEGMAAFVARTQPLIYSEANTVERFQKIAQIMGIFGYRMFWHCEPHWNPSNFRQTTTNHYGPLTDLNLICFPPGETAVPDHLLPATDFAAVAQFAADA